MRLKMPRSRVQSYSPLNAIFGTTSESVYPSLGRKNNAKVQSRQ